MTVGAHLLGWLVVAAVGAGAGVLAVGMRRILLPAAAGPPARLADAVLAVSAVCVLIEAVGVAGELSRASLLIGALVLGTAGALLLRRVQLGARFAADRAAADAAAGGGAPALAAAGGGAPAPGTAGRPDGRPDGGTRPGRLALVAGTVVVTAAGAVAGLWFAQVGWTLRHGVLDYDSLNYHLPFALDWYQTGRIGPLVLAAPDSPVGTYPADPELLHAAGMTAFQRDVLTPLLNLGWLALAALAGWTVGRRRGAPLAGLATVVAVASLPVIVQSQPGTAMTDMTVLAALLAGVALLLEAGQGRGWLVVSGLAVGLALGSKLTAVAAVAALAVVVIVVARRAAWSWFAGLALTGGFWYVRNLIATGSPIPSLHIPGLPSGHYQAFDKHSESVASQLGNLDLVRTWYVPSLHDAFGPLWPVLLLLIAAGTVAAVVAGVRGGPARRLVGLLGAATAIAVVGFLVTPTTGGLLFGTCLRYLLPAGLLGLALVLLVLPAGRGQHLYAVVLGAFAIVNVAAGWRLRWFYPSSPRPVVAWVTGAAALLLGVLLLVGQAARRRRAAAGAGARQASAPREPAMGGFAPMSDLRAASLNRSSRRRRNRFRRPVPCPGG